MRSEPPLHLRRARMALMLVIALACSIFPHAPLWLMPEAGAASLTATQVAFSVPENCAVLPVIMRRSSNTQNAESFDYATSDGTASERSDYTTAVGTLRFAPGETEKTINILISEDSLAEGNETFNLNISLGFGFQLVFNITISDDGDTNTGNAIDNASTFVCQQYHDFFNRQPDSGGQQFWTNQITSCGSDANCIDIRRTNVSAAFFLSTEFQQTGYFVFRFYRASFTDTAQRPRALPRYREFLRDSQEVGRDVIAGVGNWQAQLAQNRQDFALRWVQRAEFTAQFPQTMTPQTYVNTLFARSGATPTQAENDAAIAAYNAGGVSGRAAALTSVVDSGSVYNAQYNAACVLMQYLGYLRRSPDDAPNAGDFGGYDFWLSKMNQFTLPGEDMRDEQTAIARVARAEMVRSFIVSPEYRQRFGQP